jgi:NADPH-dependent glutamate synthase beta subunit-like oxidoreductase
LTLVGEGKWKEAWEAVLEENPFPGICGRICDHPCEVACYRGRFDEALAITAWRGGGDYGRNLRISHPSKKGRKERIAIVGSGPSGLSCAYFLRKLGYHPWSSKPFRGQEGRCEQRYRLSPPQKILDQEIDRIKRLGVKFEMNRRLGKDLTFKELSRYDAVFLSFGASSDLSFKISGSPLRGVFGGLDF